MGIEAALAERLGLENRDLRVNLSMEELFHALPGVDAATADRLLILYGATDRIPLDDAAVAFLRDRHFGGRTPTPEEIRQRYAGFGEWKGLAYWFEEVAATLWPAVGVGG